MIWEVQSIYKECRINQVFYQSLKSVKKGSVEWRSHGYQEAGSHWEVWTSIEEQLWDNDHVGDHVWLITDLTSKYLVDRW